MATERCAPLHRSRAIHYVSQALWLRLSVYLQQVISACCPCTGVGRIACLLQLRTKCISFAIEYRNRNKWNFFLDFFSRWLYHRSHLKWKELATRDIRIVRSKKNGRKNRTNKCGRVWWFGRYHYDWTDVTMQIFRLHAAFVAIDSVISCKRSQTSSSSSSNASSNEWIPFRFRIYCCHCTFQSLSLSALNRDRWVEPIHKQFLFKFFSFAIAWILSESHLLHTKGG